MTVIRAARRDEAQPLSDLALRSKGHWNYDPEFLEACRASLTLTPEYIDSNPVFVLEEDGHRLGFYSLLGSTPPEAELDYLFVDVPAIGTGIGARLWLHAIAKALESGFATLLIEADPFAEGFYLAKGAQRIGGRPSSTFPGRVLPLLRFDLAPVGSR